MKTIEQKAKRYDEAIERVENIRTAKCETTFMLTKGLLEHIFPVLAESEDEKIRKIMIEHFKNKPEQYTFGGLTNAEVVAWLEKQGEQKSIKHNNDATIDSNLNDYCCKVYNALHKENGGNLSFERLQHLAMDIYKWCKEQHILAEWSEEDNKIIEEIINDIECARAINYHAPKEGYEFRKNWLKSLRFQNHWKPSDEMLEALYRVIPENTMVISEDEMLLDKLYQGLKYGRVLSEK